jgi:hypothetical protein
MKLSNSNQNIKSKAKTPPKKEQFVAHFIPAASGQSPQKQSCPIPCIFFFSLSLTDLIGSLCCFDTWSIPWPPSVLTGVYQLFDMEPFSPIEPFKDAFLGPQVEINELPSNLRRANTVAPGTIKRNLELKAARERTATGVPVKGSHELLGKLQRSQTHRPLVARPPGRKAGHFTVRSVGQNGKIFLR